MPARIAARTTIVALVIILVPTILTSYASNTAFAATEYFYEEFPGSYDNYLACNNLSMHENVRSGEPYVLGTKRIAVVVIGFQDLPYQFKESDYRALERFAMFFEKSSYGLFSWNVTFSGKSYVLPNNTLNYDRLDSDKIVEDMFMLASSDYEGFRDFYAVLVMYPGTADKHMETDEHGGFAIPYPHSHLADGKEITTRFAFAEFPFERGMFDDGRVFYVMVHEVGHDLGLPDLYYAYDESMWLGSFIDVMKDSTIDFSSWSKLKLGWITDSDILQVNPGESSEVRIISVESQSTVESEYRAVKLPITDRKYFLVEAREGIGVYVLEIDETGLIENVKGIDYLLDKDDLSKEYELLHLPLQVGDKIAHPIIGNVAVVGQEGHAFTIEIDRSMIKLDVIRAMTNRPPVVGIFDHERIDNTWKTLVLNGEPTYDPDCDPLSYTWKQISGPIGVINDPHAVYTMVSFSSNEYISNAEFELVVSDGISESSGIFNATVPTESEIAAAAPYTDPQQQMMGIAVLSAIGASVVGGTVAVILHRKKKQNGNNPMP